jgi:hypothetical protein
LDTISSGGFIFDVGANWGFQPGGTHIGFIIKEGSGEVTTTMGLHIKDSLILAQGTWRFTNQNDTLALENGCLVKASDTAFVDGMIARSGDKL